MKSIILAAGIGSRLRKYTKDKPKCMLKFAGKTLIERQIESLRRCGIKDITVVKGYMAEKINYQGVKYYVNKDFESGNMVETLFKAEKEMNDDILVSYSDIIYEDRIIKRMIEDDSEIGVCCDDDYLEYWKARIDDLKKDIESFVIKNGTIVDLGNPNCNIDEAKYRYVGLMKFKKTGVEKLKFAYQENKNKYFASNERWKRSKSFRKAYMTCMLQELIDRGNKVTPIIVSRGWLEFDNAKDYERANDWLRDGTLNRFLKI